MKRVFAAVLCSALLNSIALTQEPAPHQTNQTIKGGRSITVAGKTVMLKEAYFKKLEKIRKLGVTVFYPAFIPARYSLASVTLSDDEFQRSLDYQIEFCDRHKLCFRIESADGGIGSAPDGDKSFKGWSKSLGRYYIERFDPDPKSKKDKQPYYLSEWMEDRKMVAAKRKGLKLDPPRNGGRFHHLVAYGVTDKEAVAIVKSLSPVE